MGLTEDELIYFRCRKRILNETNLAHEQLDKMLEQPKQSKDQEKYWSLLCPVYAGLSLVTCFKGRQSVFINPLKKG